MNKLFRIVWSAIRGTFIVAHEKANTHGKPSSTRRGAATALMTSLLAGSGLVLAAPPVNTLPTGGQIVGGATAGTIATNGNAMTINQVQQRIVANWDSYSIGQNASVHYQQPTGGVALNRVTGSQPSEIYGKLTATGDVYLINANGVMFGRTAQVDVGALVASTANISDADFMAGKAKFARNGATGKIDNEGQLTAGLGGYIALLAPEVRNSGVILAQMGTVVLAAGEAVELQFDSGRLANVRVDPSTIATLIDNKNAVLVPGGLIILSAQAASKLQGAAIKNSGTLDASSLTMKGGRIVLEASSSVENTGTITAAGNASHAGGQVEITAPQVVQNGTVDVSGSTGGSVQIKANDSLTMGGQILAKGLVDRGGDVRLLLAQTLSLQPGNRIDVSGNTQGGAVYAESANAIKVEGSIDASSTNGSGGSIELAAGTEAALNNATLDVSGAAQGGTIRISARTTTHTSLADPSNPINDPTAPPQDRPHVAVTGTSALRSSSRSGRGGKVVLTGDDLLLGMGSSIDATGTTGGGEVLFGGDWQGSNGVYQASTVNLEKGAKIDASATLNGDGGKVVLWSNVSSNDSHTTVAGSIKAEGAGNGKGGQVETSGHRLTIADTASVKTGGGQWLLDPFDFTIGTDITGAALSIALASGNVSITTTNTAASCIGATCGAGASGNGDIIFNDAVSWSTNTLTLSAYRHIAVNSVLSVSGNAGLTLTTNSGNATGRDMGYLKMQQVSGSFGGKINWTSSGALSMNGSAYTKVSSEAELAAIGNASTGNYFLANDISFASTWTSLTGFAGVLDGLGHTLGNLSNGASTSNDQGLFGTATGATIQNVGITSGTVTGADNVGAFVGRVSGGTNYMRNVFTAPDTSGTANVSIEPDGTAQRSYIGGIVGKLDNSTLYVVDSRNGAFVHSPSGAANTITKVGGILGGASGTFGITFANSSNSGEIISGTVANKTTLGNLGSHVGGIVGEIDGANAPSILDIAGTNTGGFISNSGNIYGNSYVGGIGGRVFATGNVNRVFSYLKNTGEIKDGGGYAGGLFGILQGGSASNSITLQFSANKGNVTSSSGTVGGLVGYMAALGFPTSGQVHVYHSYNEGAVTASGQVGGLVGRIVAEQNWIWFQNDYNVGAVSGGGLNVGGIVGDALIDITNVGGSQIEIQQVYNAGTVTGGTAFGTLSPTNSNSYSGRYEFVNSYYLSGNGYTTGAANTIMQTGVNPTQTSSDGLKTVVVDSGAGLNSSNWAQNAAINNGYPYLKENVPITPVTITVNAMSKIYGDASNPLLTSQYSLSGCTGCITLDWGSILTSTTAAGSYGYSTANLLALTYVSGSAGSYSITWGGTSFTVTPRPINITVDSGQTKVYGQANPTYTYTAEAAGSSRGLVSGDTFAGALARVSGENVGAYAINSVGTLANSNYTITVVPANFSVTPAALTVTASAQNKTYGSTLSLGASAFTSSGLQNGETIGSAALAASGGTAATDNAGSYTITPSAATGGTFTASNYNITYSTGTLTVNPALITLTAGDQTKTYGNTLNLGTTAYSITAGTLKNSDTISGVSLSSAGAVNTANVNTYAITPSAAAGTGGFNTNNYTISYGNGTLTVNKVPLTVTANNDSKTYNAVAYTGGNGVTYSGFVLGQDASALTGTLAYTSGTSNGAINAGTYTIRPSGYLSTNYSYTYADGTLTINKAPLTITGAAINDRAYTGNNVATFSNYGTLSGTFYGSDAGNLSINTGGTTATFDSVNAANGIGVTAVYSVTGSAAGNYLVITPTGLTANITPKILTVSSLVANDKVYDGNANATLSNWGSVTTGVGSETVVLNHGTASFSDANAANGKTVTAIGYALADGSDGGLASNYQLSSTSATTTANISAKTVTLTATKTYDGTIGLAGYVTLGGFIGSETLNYSGASASNSHVATANKYISAIALTDGSNGGLAGNYQLPTLNAANAPVTISAATLTPTLSNTGVTKVYDGDTSAAITPTYSFTGLVAGDTTATLTNTGKLYNSKDVATADHVTVSGLAISGVTGSNSSAASDYVLSTSSLDVAATITRKDVSVTSINIADKVYDGTTNATSVLSTVLSGVIAADSANVNTTGTLAGFSGKDVGNYSISVTGMSLTGSAIGNYNLTSSTATDSSVAITPKAVTLSAAKTYDGTTSLAGYVTLGGFIGSETLNYTGATASNSHVATANKYVSAITLTDGGSGGLAGNYQLPTLNAANAPLTISAATLTPTLTNTGVAKVYDGSTNSALTPTWSFGGLVSGDTAATLAYTGRNYNNKDVLAADTVTVSGLSISGVTGSNGSAASDYVLDATSKTVAGTITPKTLTVSGLAASNKVYDATTDVAITNWGSVTTGVGSETVVLNHGTASFADKNKANGKTVTAIDYALADGGNGGLASNYQLSSTSATTTADITARTVTLAGSTGVTKTYDGRTSMPVGADGYESLTGVVGGDSVSISGVPLFDSANAGSRSVLIGTVGIAGTDAGNYTLTWTNGSGTINKAPLTVSANADAKFVTQGDTTGIYNSVSYGGFVNGENASALNIAGLNITRSNAAENNAGVYASVLVPSGVTAGNYAITYVNGTYTIVPANQLLVRVQNSSTSYGTAASYAIQDARYMDGSNVIHTLATPTQNGDTFTYSDGVGGTAVFTLGPVSPQTSTAGQLKAGAYSIGASGIAETSSNFSNALTVVGGLTVNQKALTANASNVTKVYDSTTAMTNVVLGYTGLETGDLVSISGNGNFSNKNVGTNKAYAVTSLTLGSADSGNYYLIGGDSFAGTNGEITQKLVSLSATKTYDGNTTLGPGIVTIATGVGSETLSYNDASINSKNVVDARYVSAITLLDVLDASGGMASNYRVDLSGPSANNTASVTPKTLTTTVTAADKTYNGTTAADLTLGSLLGLIGSETLGLSGVGNFSDSNVGIGKTVLAQLALADASGLASNYAISDVTTTATINPVPNVVPPLPPSVPATPPPPPNVPDPSPPPSVPDTSGGSSSGGSSSGGSSSGSGSSSGGDTSSGSGSGSSGSSSSGGSSSGSGSSSGTDTSSGSGSGSSSSGGSSSGSGSSSGGDTSSGSGSDSSSSGGSSSGSGSSSGTDTSSGSGSGSSSFGGSSSGSGSSSGTDTSSGSGSGSSSSGGSSSGSSSSSGGDTSSGSGSGSSSSGGSSSGSGSSSGGDTSSGSGSGSSSSGGSSSGSGSSSGGDTSSGSGSGGSSSGGSSSGSGSSSGTDTSSGSGSGGRSDTGSGLATNTSATGRDSSDGRNTGQEQITVTLLKQPTETVTGAILVEVPSEIVRTAAGFSFQLPKELTDLSVNSRSLPEATLVNGDPLPPWLRFIPASNMFVAKDVPAGGLPIQAVIKIGRTRTVLLVTERNS